MADGRDYGYFWNDDGSGDRTYNADSFEYWLKKFFTTGVFAGDLQVTAGGSYTVNVATGYANVNGKVKDFYNAQTFTVPSANSTYPRIDTIVVRRDDTNKIISLQYVTGAYSGRNPEPKAPTRSGAIYELVLAEIYVGAGVTEILQRDITDKRADSTVCGIVTGTVEEMDFSQFTSQFEAYFAEFKEGNEKNFDAWFQEMKDQLSTDAAGHLQLEIDGHTSQIQALEQSIDNVEDSKADKDDLTSISITGATNNTGSTISKNTFFYKSGILVRALLDIANGAAFTENTNYEVVTAGGLNNLVSLLNGKSNAIKIQMFTIPNRTYAANSEVSINVNPSLSGYTLLAVFSPFIYNGGVVAKVTNPSTRIAIMNLGNSPITALGGYYAIFVKNN